jgi:hypothetical protein
MGKPLIREQKEKDKGNPRKVLCFNTHNFEPLFADSFNNQYYS